MYCAAGIYTFTSHDLAALGHNGLDLFASMFAPCSLGCPGTSWQEPSLSGMIFCMSVAYLRWYRREGAGSSEEQWNKAADS